MTQAKRMGIEHTLRYFDCKLVRVIDGDTIDMVVDLGWNVSTLERIRIVGVNAPELGTVEGRAVKQAVQAWLLNNESGLGLYSFSKLDKYGRRLADVFNPSQPIPHLSDYLIATGQAVEYNP